MKKNFDVTGKNRQENKSDIMSSPDGEELEKEWLSGICEYNGMESTLPIGGISKIPDWYPENEIVKRWWVGAPEEETGYIEKKASELKKTDTIIGAILNVNTIKQTALTYGERFYKITDANNEIHTPKQWARKYGTNGLGLIAIRNMRKRLERM